jgi:hypothetical protein
MDRLYVTGEDGRNLGYRDLRTGQDHIVDPTFAQEFAGILGSSPATVPEPREPPSSEGAPTANHTSTAPPVPTQPASPDCEDLAQRRAGAMAREQALALKQAAPVRTFVARVLGVHTEERAWRIGADGEEMVAAQLAKLARKDPRVALPTRHPGRRERR